MGILPDFFLVFFLSLQLFYSFLYLCFGFGDLCLGSSLLSAADSSGLWLLAWL